MDISDEDRVANFLNTVVGPIVAKRDCIARELSWESECKEEEEVNQRTSEEVVGLMKDFAKQHRPTVIAVFCTSRRQLNRFYEIVRKTIGTNHQTAKFDDPSRKSSSLIQLTDEGGVCVELMLLDVFYCDPEKHRGCNFDAVLSLGPLPGKAQEDTWQKMVASKLPDVTPYQELDL